jgi:hypothetical protein
MTTREEGIIIANLAVEPLAKWPEEGIGNGTMTVAGGHHTFLNLRR